MSHLRTLRAASFVPAVLYLPFHQAIHAYIDPGTGSIVLQAVIGALVGGFRCDRPVLEPDKGICEEPVLQVKEE